MPRPLYVQNALLYNGKPENSFERRKFYTTDVVVERMPQNALTVDLSGYAIYPGLINPHDHLEMNHYPRTKFRERYDNASEWSADVNAHLNDTPFKELRAYPLEDRCFIGGLKNLLSGVTTVIHHNPPHNPLFRSSFPVRVVKNYHWAHSLYQTTPERIRAIARKTRYGQCFFIHLAEGTDAAAAEEYGQLKAAGGILEARTVLIHCVGMTREDIASAASDHDFVLGIIWCPTTNLYMLGKTLDFETVWHDGEINIGALAIGSDSRLTADGDLLDEIRAARRIAYPNSNAEAYDLRHIVFLGNAFLTRIESLYGYLKLGAPADWIALPADRDILDVRRADLALVVRGGVPQIGNPDVMAKFTDIETIPARLDDTPKSINAALARQIARCSLKEPGLELLQVPDDVSPVKRLWNGVLKR